MGKAYEKIREAVKNKKGEMIHERRGQQLGGVWIVTINKNKKIFESTGEHYPDLDELYELKPGIEKGKTWHDYQNIIIPEKLEEFFKQFE